MSEARRSPALSSRIRRRIEQAGVWLFLGAIGFFLWRAQDLIAWSEPAAWYDFGRHFADGFGRTPLAYGFPWLVSGAVALFGPVWAYLINLPLLLLLAGLVYGLARSLVSREPGLHGRLGAFAGGLAVALWVARNAETLVPLTSPYRDPLACALILLACLLLVHHAGAPGRSPAWLAASAASLGLAASTRESSVVLLAPFALYLALSLERSRWARAAALFAGVFALVCIPMALHNHGVTGHFWMPAHTAAEETAAATPGVDAAGEARSLSRELGEPLGWATAALFAAGLGSALLRRRLEVLALCVPAALITLLFHGGTPTAVGRHLFVVDLFALPVAAAGGAAVLHLALRPLGTGRMGRTLAVVAGGAACVAAAGVALGAARPPPVAFRIEDARALRNHVEALLGEAPVFGEPVIARILRCFVSRGDQVQPLASPGPSGAGALGAIRAALRDGGEAYLVYQTTPLKPLVRSHFDFHLLASFSASSYGLADRGLLQPRFHVDRLQAWQTRESRQSLLPRRAGPHLLAVDLGALSSLERRFARVRWNDQVLDEEPRDGINTYRVQVDEASARVRVRLESDAPVPVWIGAELVPLSRPLVMHFDPAARMSYQSLLSGEFFRGPVASLPALRGGGHIEVPTPEWRDTVFVGVARVEVEGGAGREGVLTIGVEERPFYRVQLEPHDQDPSAESSYGSRISFAFLPPLVRGDPTRLSWDWGGDGAGWLALRSLALHRQPLTPSLEIDVGGDDEAFIMDGFEAARFRHEPLPQRYRWTGPRAELRLPVGPDRRRARLSIRYYEGERPAGTPAADPVFKLNRVELEGRRERQRQGELDEVTASFEVPPGALSRLVNHLVIRSVPWQERGVMLDRVTVERVDDGPRG